MSKIQYREGYKYQLASSYSINVDIYPTRDIDTEFLSMELGSTTLSIRKGYAWDGPSWPAIDTKNFMRGSLVHDALYQLIREGLLSIEHRGTADSILRRICKEDGMSTIRAWWVFWGVRLGGGPAASADGERSILEAP